ncbi:MAG: YcgL domain-containing protein [Oleiphilaceae bacterium]|nr:YcgL domain-containing protein [Oleiphilaceae bacterium]
MTKRLCSVFKSSRKAEMYVYVDRKVGTTDLPEALLKVFGEPIHVMDLILTEEKKLARASAPEVLSSIEEQGFYLQMPPSENAPEPTIPAPRDTLHG